MSPAIRAGHVEANANGRTLTGRRYAAVRGHAAESWLLFPATLRLEPLVMQLEMGGGTLDHGRVGFGHDGTGTFEFQRRADEGLAVLRSHNPCPSDQRPPDRYRTHE